MLIEHHEFYFRKCFENFSVQFGPVASSHSSPSLVVCWQCCHDNYKINAEVHWVKLEMRATSLDTEWWRETMQINRVQSLSVYSICILLRQHHINWPCIQILSIANPHTDHMRGTSQHLISWKVVWIGEAFYKISVIVMYFTAPASPPCQLYKHFLPCLVMLTWSTLPPLVLEEISTTSTITITTGIHPYTNCSCKLTAQNNIGSSTSPS